MHDPSRVLMFTIFFLLYRIMQLVFFIPFKLMQPQAYHSFSLKNASTLSVFGWLYSVIPIFLKRLKIFLTLHKWYFKVVWWSTLPTIRCCAQRLRAVDTLRFSYGLSRDAAYLLKLLQSDFRDSSRSVQAASAGLRLELSSSLDCFSNEIVLMKQESASSIRSVKDFIDSLLLTQWNATTHMLHYSQRLMKLSMASRSLISCTVSFSLPSTH